MNIAFGILFSWSHSGCKMQRIVQSSYRIGAMQLLSAAIYALESENASSPSNSVI